MALWGMHLALVAIHPNANPEAIPLGPACVAAAIQADPTIGPKLRTAIYEATLADGDKPQALLAALIAAKPDFIGLSVYVWNRPVMANLAKALRASLPTVIIFAGGPEVSAGAPTALEELSLDFVVCGEAENSIVAALRVLCDPTTTDSLDTIRGIVTPANRALETKPSPTPDPQNLKSPWLSQTLLPQTHGGVLWELARGCPFACSFCFESRGQPGVRFFPLERIEAELRIFAQSQVRHVFVLDPTFNANKQRSHEILRLFKKLGRGMHFSIELRAEFIDEAQAQAFAGLDCSLQIGLQSANSAVLKWVNRNLNKADFAAKIRLLNQYGIIFGLDLLYGLPGDSLNSFRHSIEWTLGLQPNHVDIFPLAVLPGTQLAADALGFQLDYDPQAPYIVRGQPGFPPADMAAAARLAQAANIFYNQGRAVPWFKIVAKALQVSAVGFMEGFADFLGTKAAALNTSGHRQIELAQLDYLEQRCDQAELRPLWPAIQDLVQLNGAYSRAMAEGQSCSLRLHYSQADLESPAILDLAKFVGRVKPRPQTIHIKG